MKILVNASTITVGGGVQAAVSFIEHVAERPDPDIDFIFALSPAVVHAVPERVRSAFQVEVVSSSPARPLSGMRARRQLLALERRSSPALVYSLGFPSYVRFRSPEVGRYTNGWEICDSTLAGASSSIAERMVRRLRSAYRLRWAKTATFFETQTEVAKAGIVRCLRTPSSRIKVIPNSVNPRFITAGFDAKGSARRSSEPLRIFCLSAAFRHKNLTIVPEIASILESRYGLTCTFVLTLPPRSVIYRDVADFATRFGVTSLIENVGTLTLDGCVTEFRRASVLFLPTLFEIFSATYLEAMAMGVPIVTTDLDFAHAICGDAALYYSPQSPVEAADVLARLLHDDGLRDTLARRGRDRLKAFPCPEGKNQMLVSWLKEIGDQAGVHLT